MRRGVVSGLQGLLVPWWAEGFRGLGFRGLGFRVYYFGGVPKLGVPFWGVLRESRGSIRVIQGLGSRGFPKLGVPFWGSP